MRKIARSATRSTTGASSIAEMAPTMLVLSVVAFVLLNLVAIGMGYAHTALAAFQGVKRASTAYSLDEAKQSVATEAANISNNPLGIFSHMQPVGGYNQAGADLYFEVTDIATKDTKVYGPNVGIPAPVDTKANIYECSSKVCFDVGPLLNMGAIPGLAAIPAVGAPARMTYDWKRSVEHPESLVAASQDPVLAGGTSTVKIGNYLVDTTGVPPPQKIDSGWNTPNIYEMIKNAGQRVVQEEVFLVRADNFNWTDTPINLKPGQKIWIDYRAEGAWSFTPAIGNTDADGYPIGTNGPPSTPWKNDYGMAGAMIGKINGATFTMGKQLWNFTPPQTGPLKMAINDATLGPDGSDNIGDYADNTGVMTCRVIVTSI